MGFFVGTAMVIFALMLAFVLVYMLAEIAIPIGLTIVVAWLIIRIVRGKSRG